MEQKTFNSFDGTPLNVRIWNDVILPKGIVQIVHDIQDHSGRYNDFANELQKAGYLVFCLDLRGCGLSESKESLGYHDGDIFKDSVSDVIFFNNLFSREYSLPSLLAGFGYGGIIVQAVLTKNLPLRGAIIASVGRFGKGKSVFGRIATKFLPKKKQCFLYNTSMSRYNKSFKSEKGQKLWFSSDKAQRKEYISDALCEQTPSNNFCYSLSKGLSAIQANDSFSEETKRTPVAFFAGRKDPNVGNKASSVITLYKEYRKIGFSSVRLFIYENARHSILRESESKCYILHITKFINRCFPSK